ncbi:fanconi-associated nuclease 1-like isoform X2 [Apostichopus japonicus]|uniref:fanconi-associated nuclease 1-like isoform X2 n=1 Tax=Stichopus japonicus TaxID=307972 RepID=UPI003AB1C5C3
MESSPSTSNPGVKNKNVKKGKKSKRKLDYKKETKEEKHLELSTPEASSLLSLFAKAKPPKLVSCPVCSCKVELAFINQHLDRGCVTIDHGSVLSTPQQVQENESLHLQANGCLLEQNGVLSNKRKVADVKGSTGDKRKRDKLSRKYQSHSLYQSDSLLSDTGHDSGSDQSVHMLDSHSWMNNKEDMKLTDSVTDEEDYPSSSDVLSCGSSVGRSKMQSESQVNMNATSDYTSSSLIKYSSDSRTSLSPDERITGSKLEDPSNSRRSSSESKASPSASPSISVSVNKKMKLQMTRKSKLSLKRKRQATDDISSLDTSQKLLHPDAVPKQSMPTDNNVSSQPYSTQETISPSQSPPESHLSSTRSSPTKSPHKAKEPYYVSNFKFVLNTVLGNEDDRELLTEEDLQTVNLFNELSDEGQQLYIRIFQRKLAWLRISKLQYPRIAEDLAPFAEEICKKGLFLCESEMNDLDEVLRQLPAPDIKLLTRDLKVSCPDGTQKSDMVAACIKHCKKQKGLFGSSLQPFMLKKAKQYLGPCIKLCKEHRAVFTRICLLFSPVLMTDDEENASGGQNQLQALLLVNFGKVIYPAYKINRTRKIFRGRDDLIRYETALQYEHDILGALSTNDFVLAMKLWQSAKSTHMELMEDEDLRQHVGALPSFLQHFTAPSVYEHIHYLGVEILQKQRRYGEAVEELKQALLSCEFRKDSRGSRWDRLALNLDQHLKDPNQALDAILEGLADENVQTGHRLALEQRAEKILNATSNKKLAKRRKEEFNLHPLTVKDLPSITIQGKILPYTGPGIKNTFFRESSEELEEGVELCSVEQVAIDYYLRNGYTNGKHGEGSTFCTIIFLLFWDEIFMDLPDVFSYPYQSGPLDLRTQDFFPNREEALKKKLDELKQADEESLQNWLQEVWTEHEGEACAGVNWDLFTLDEAKDLLGCMGGPFISATAGRLLRSHRHCRGGMPDLVVWNTQTRTFKMSEVKGPGDRLSHKQILWIQFFKSIGSDAEVCHVQGLQSRNLKHRQLQRAQMLKNRSPKKQASPKKSPSKSPRRKKTPVKLKQKST